MSGLRAIATPILAVLLCMAPSHAQTRRVYLPTAGDEDIERFESLRAALASPDPDSTEVADLVCELLVAAGETSTRNGLVATSERHHRGLRARIIDVLPSLSDEVSKKVRAFQQRAATQALRRNTPPGTAELLQRFPASELGADAAELLWQRAFEEGDTAQCWALSRLLSTLHPQRLKAPGPQALLAHLNASPASGDPRATARGDTARLVVSKVSPLAEPSAGHAGTHSPSFPLLAGNRVCVSNGARLKIFDLEGTLQGAIPGHATAASEAPSASTLFQARLAQWGGAVFSPLVLERWLAPSRKRAKEDGSLSDRYYTLLAFDPQLGRILWWDGDRGPSSPAPADSDSGAPGSAAPGLERLEPKLKRSLDLGHVIAVAADGSRVYVALTRAGQEPQLALMAFRRDTGDAQPFVLRPAWTSTTHLLAAEPTERSADTRPIAAEIAASLALDGRGQLVCTTDLGLAACVDTRSGDLLWTVQDRQDKGQSGSFRNRRGRSVPVGYRAPPEPAQFQLRASGERQVVLFGSTRLFGLNMHDGSLNWELQADGQRANGPRLPQQRATRLLKVKATLTAYGGNTLISVSESGKRLGLNRLPARCQGQGLAFKNSVLLPLRRGTRVELRRFSIGGAQRSDDGTSPTVASILGFKEPVNLLETPKGVVAASRSRVVFLKWQ